MKTNLKILLAFLFLILACDKKNKAELLNETSMLLMKIDSLEKENINYEVYLDSLHNYVLNNENDSINRNVYFKLAVKYYDIGNLEKYFDVTNEIKELSIKKNDTAHIAKALYYVGDYYLDKTELDSAFKYYVQSEKLFKSIKDSLNAGKISLYKAGIFYDTGNYSESEVEGIHAMKLLLKTKNNRLIYECNVLIALTLSEMKSYEKSFQYFNQALRQLDLLENEDYPKEKIIKSRASCFNNIGTVYQKQEDYKKAISLYEKGLQTKNLRNSKPQLYAMLLNNTAYSKMKLGNMDGVKETFFESLHLRDSLKILPGIVSSKIRIGEYYLYEKDTVKALKYLKESLSLAKEINSNLDILASLKLLTENDRENKAYYSNLYFKASDSMQQMERATRNKFARIAYESDQIEEKNEILSKRNTNIIIISASVIFFLIAIFLINRLKSKNKELNFIQEQQKANEKIYQLMLTQQTKTEEARKEERNRIAMELHDGIVNSIFTTRFNLIQLDPEASDKKEQLVKELENTEHEIRRISHDLKQNLLFEDKSFPEIVENLVISQTNSFNTKFDLSIDKYINWALISADDKIHVYRILQEAIQNVNKYSKAERCFIMLLKTADALTIRIWDNGIGFNVEKSKKGIGIKNIEERTKALGGSLKISSKINEGTTIEVVF